MKKVFTILGMTGLMFLSSAQSIYAQTEPVAEKTFHQVLKQNPFLSAEDVFMFQIFYIFKPVN